MAKKRTKKEKIKASTKRKTIQPAQGVSYSLDDELLQVSVHQQKKQTKSTETSFGYDTSLIVADLKKTVGLSTLVFSLLGILYYLAQTGQLSFLGY